MERTDPTLVDRRDVLRLTGGLAAGATAGLAGCAENVPGGTGSTGDSTDGGGDGATATGLLSTAVSDQPGDIGDFESCIVTLDGIWVGPEVGSEEDDGDDDGNETDADAEAAEAEDETDGETEQNDGDAGGPPADAPPGGNSSSEDTASGSQDGNETEDGGNATDPEDSGESDDDSESEEDDESEEENESEDDESDGDDGSEENDGNGRTYYEFEEAQEADLTELQGEAQQLVGEHELSVGTYQFLQLDVAGVRGTLTDGSEAVVTTPGNAPLKFNQSFDVREGYRTTFLADFTPVKRGNGSYLFQPVASETEVSYQAIESGDGGSGGNTTDPEGNTTEPGGNTTDPDGDGTDGSGNTTDPGGSGTDSGGNETDAGGNETTA